MSLGTLVNSGVFVNYGTVTCHYGFTNSGTIINYGSFTIAGASTNNGTINNESGAVFSFASGATLTNSNLATVINSGSITIGNSYANYITNYGTITNSGAIASNITNSGTVINSGTLSGTVSGTAAVEVKEIASYGSEFMWNDESESGDWDDGDNWLRSVTYTDGTTGYEESESYPNSSDAIVYLPATVYETIYIDSDITVGNIYFHYSDNETIDFEFSNGAVLTCETCTFCFPDSGTTATINLIGNGILSCSEITRTRRYADEMTVTMDINSGAAFRITDSFIQKERDDYIVSFEGSGKMYIPGDGVILDDVGDYDPLYSIADTLTVLPYSDPEYYSFEIDYDNATITFTRYQSSGEDIYYPLTVTKLSTAGAFSIDSVTLEALTTYNVTVPYGDTSVTYDIGEETAFTLGDSFTADIYTPDGRFKLGTFSYPKVEVSDFHTYYWTGEGDGSTWTESANWAFGGTSGSQTVYVSVASYDDGNYDGLYPGYNDGDTAVFDAGEGASNLTLDEADYTLTIRSLVSGEGKYTSTRAAINGTGLNADSATINSEGTWLFANCNFGTLNAKTGTLRAWGSGVNGNGLQVKNLVTESDFILSASGSEVSVYISETFTNSGTVSSTVVLTVGGSTENNGTIECGANKVLFNGDYSSTGILSLTGTGYFEFAGSSNTVNNITIDGNGSVINSSSAPVQITTALISASPVFKGDFTFGSSSSFEAGASNYVYFIDGNVDFSAFTVSDSTFSLNSTSYICFYNSLTDGSYKTFKTPASSSLTVPNFLFGGNVDIILGNTLTCTSFSMVSADSTVFNLSDSYFVTNGFTSKLTAGSYSLIASNTDIERCSTADGVFGTFELVSGTALFTSFYTHSGTNVILDSGTTALITGSFSDTSTSALPNTITVNGLLNISAVTAALSDNTTLTNAGTINASSLSAGKIVSTGKELFIAGGTIGCTDTSSYFGNVTVNSGVTTTLSAAVSIAGSLTCNGTLSTNGYTLTLNGTSESLLSVTGEGTLLVTGGYSLKYLSVGKDIKITADSSEVEAGAFAVSEDPAVSVPSEGTTSDDYSTVFDNGWDLGFTFSYIWNGSKSTSWNNRNNWEGKRIPGLTRYKSTGAGVEIPDGLTNYPVLDVAAKIKSLTVGSSENSIHDASIELNSYDLTLTVALTNYGTIEYSDSARILDSAANPLNDCQHDGTVLYSNTTANTITDFGEVDYANLSVKNSAAAASSEIAVCGDLNLETDFTSTSYLLACDYDSENTSDKTWTVSDGAVLTCDIYADFASASKLTLSGNMNLTGCLYLYSGIFDAESSSLNISGDFACFGSNYSAVDRHYSSSNTRFAFYGYSSLAYQNTAGFGAELSSNGADFTIGGNLYVNGADLSSVSFVIPEISSLSSPVFNNSSDVTDSQWGAPYAVALNSEISACSVTCSDSTVQTYITAASDLQNCADLNGNSGFQFDYPKIAEAYTVSDSKICFSFDMDLENSAGEVVTNAGLISYSSSSVLFDGNFYLDEDCTENLADSAYAAEDIPAGTKFYLKNQGESYNWNTDATGLSYGTDDSTDLSGEHRTKSVDLCFLEGVFYAAEGKTMCRNYGSGYWKDEESAEYEELTLGYETSDKVQPVFLAVYTGQEAHTVPEGKAIVADFAADSQKPYDAHNFIEFRFSEPVNIGDLSVTPDDENEFYNALVQSDSDYSSAENFHGGAIINQSEGIKISGFGTISSGSVSCGVKPSYSSIKYPHSIYRKFALSYGDAVQKNLCRFRIAVAGYVEGTVSHDGLTFYNWAGYIDSSASNVTPSGTFELLTAGTLSSITDASGNELDRTVNTSVTVNENSGSDSNSLYGGWDLKPPVFAVYVGTVDDEEQLWTDGDDTNRVYEVVGTVQSDTSAYIDQIELHFFDNAQNYSDSDEYKWVSEDGWRSGSTTVSYAPETSGGSRSLDSALCAGGIRRSSLDGASSAFSYTADSISGYSFGSEISQNVHSSLFRNSDQYTETNTENDGLYIALPLQDAQSTFPLTTSFVVSYNPSQAYITDLAGNRLIQTDSGSSEKILTSINSTSPSFLLNLAPLGTNKLYAVFTKPLAYNRTLLHNLDSATLSEILGKIKNNVEFVYSDSDNVDTTSVPSGDDELSVSSVELASKSDSYTALLFTLNRNVSLDDVEKIWLRINDEGEETETAHGNIKVSYIRDSAGNGIDVHTCHALSDFALNTVNVLYAYTLENEDDNWSETEIFGNSLKDGYAVYDFSEDAGVYGKVLSGHDVVFQVQFVGGDKGDGNGYFAPAHDESFSLIMDKKSHINTNSISKRYNRFTGSDWRIWVDSNVKSIAYSHNDPEFELYPDDISLTDVEDSDILKTFTLPSGTFTANEEYQFFFKILDSSENPIEINHDGDSTTDKIPLYAFSMPLSRINANDFSFIDLWSVYVSGITKQRGGVSVLNNVINPNEGEKTAIEIQMKESGNINIYVMTIDGNIIRRLEKGSVSSGTHYYYWDGKNNSGKTVARGLYFVRVAGNGIDETRKVMVVK
ncbi:FlgD immunoglobulin-like domain containing protein [Treponema sp.]|uniref:FlgD immunoglobulin-like domain containing protein n=1 Tax=Treponema sp. TaxID=166 RepID=UPI00388E4884